MDDRWSRRSRSCVRFNALILSMALLGAACGGSAETTAPETTTPATTEPQIDEVLGTTFVNPDGTEVVITDTSRVVVLNGDLSEVVWALGLGDKVVATDVSATYPQGAKDARKVGYQRALSAEGILSFEPTVVLGNTDAGPPEVIEQVIAAGVPVAILDYGSDLEAVSEKIRQVGYILGAEDEASALASQVEQDLAAVLSTAATDPTERGVLLYFRGAATQLIAGEGSGSDALFPAVGLIDGGTEAGAEGIAALTPEALIVAAPDVIVLTVTGLQSLGGMDGLLEVPGIAQTPAAQSGRILTYDAQLLLGFGPRAAELAEKLIDDISSGRTYEQQQEARE